MRPRGSRLDHPEARKRGSGTSEAFSRVECVSDAEVRTREGSGGWPARGAEPRGSVAAHENRALLDREHGAFARQLGEAPQVV